MKDRKETNRNKKLETIKFQVKLPHHIQQCF